MFQAVTPQLAEEIDQLTQDWAAWLPAAARWTPASSEPPPPRPTSPAHSHLLATVDAWWEAEHDSMVDHVLEIFTQAGGAVTDKSISRGPDGQIIERTHVEFSSPPTEFAAQRGIVERFRRRFGRRRHRED